MVCGENMSSSKRSSLSDYECKLYDDDSFAFESILDTTFESTLASKPADVGSKNNKRAHPLCSTRIETKDRKLNVPEAADETAKEEETINATGNTTVALSSYEEWMMNKMKIAKEKQEKVNEEKKQDQVRKVIDNKHHDQIRKNRLEFHKDWLQKKNYDMKKEIENEMLQKREEEEQIQAKKEEIHAKAEKEYEKWLQEHKNKQVQAIKQKKKQEEDEKAFKAEQQRKSEESFNKWMEEKKKNKFVLPTRDNPPQPGYINPQPWVAPVVPKPKPISRPASNQRSSRPPRPKSSYSPATSRLAPAAISIGSPMSEVKKRAAGSGLLRPFTATLNTSATRATTPTASARQQRNKPNNFAQRSVKKSKASPGIK